MTSPFPASASVAGSVLPIRRAEELIATLPGVLSVRIVPSETGEVDEVHVLTTDQVAPKHTVRNIESALMAQLGMRVNHRKISIATTLDAPRAVDQAGGVGGPVPTSPGLQAVPGGVTPALSSAASASPSMPTPAVPVQSAPAPIYVPPQIPHMPSPVAMPGAPSMMGAFGVPAGVPWPPRPVMPPGYGVDGVPPGYAVPVWGQPTGPSSGHPMAHPSGPVSAEPVASASAPAPSGAIGGSAPQGSPMVMSNPEHAARRLLLFEDVEVRRSRVHGVACRVTLTRDGQAFHGEAEGQDTERSRIDLAARATLQAIAAATQRAPGAERGLALEGAKGMEAFDRHFVFVSVLGRAGRESVVLTGSCEVRESAETSAVLAVLDATNRWIQFDR